MVKWSNSAKDDLRQIYNYILKDSQFYAKKVVQDILSKTETLDNFPYRGKIVSELNDKNIREIFVYSYRIIYQIVDDSTEILSLVHSRCHFSVGNDTT